MPRSSSFWSSLSLNDRTQRGLIAVSILFLALLLTLGFFEAAGWFGASLQDGLGYLFGWDRVLLPLVLVVWAYDVLKPELALLQARSIVGLLLLPVSLNPLAHLWTFGGQAPIPDAAIIDAGGKVGQVLADAATGFIGMAGAVGLFIAVLLASVMLVFHLGLEDVLFFLRYLGAAAQWIGEMISHPMRAWLDRRVMLEGAPKGFTSTEVLSSGGLSKEQEVYLDDPSEASTDEEETNADAVDEQSLEKEDELDEATEEDEEEKMLVIAKKRSRKTHPKADIPLDLFEVRDQKPLIGNPKHIEDSIRKTLAAFGIPVESAGHVSGPTVTQYMVKPAEGIKVSRIVGLQNDLALALAAHSLRIEAPIPGKPYVGIEVPNQSTVTVGMRELLETKEFRERKNNLHFILGKDVSGKPALADIAKMPHALVAGATGSGKSVCLNVLITSLLYANHPDDLKLIMVDPKRVEMQMYNGIPHLLTPVITEIPEAVNALKWCVREMTQRYSLLPTVNAKNIADYNTRVAPEEKLPIIVFVIDELADLMMTAKNEIEGPIVRLCQMARAVGIHLVLATQRPSVDVITGLIKANVPARIAFAVASAVDSKTILDQVGAERLLGRGDMLFSTSELPQPRRVQGAFISDHEIVKVVDFLKTAYGPGDYDLSVTERRDGGGTVLGGAEEKNDTDPLLSDAWDEVLRAGRASASLLQRRLKVGYSRAARILDEMQQQGWIGPENGSKGRELLRKTPSGQQMELPGTELVAEADPSTRSQDAYYDL